MFESRRLPFVHPGKQYYWFACIHPWSPGFLFYSLLWWYKCHFTNNSFWNSTATVLGIDECRGKFACLPALGELDFVPLPLLAFTLHWLNSLNTAPDCSLPSIPSALQTMSIQKGYLLPIIIGTHLPLTDDAVIIENLQPPDSFSSFGFTSLPANISVEVVRGGAWGDGWQRCG